MNIRCNKFSDGLEEVVKKLEGAKARSPITFVGIYGSSNSGKTHLVKAVKKRFTFASIEEIPVEVREKNGARVYLHQLIPKEGVVFFPFFNNKDNTLEDPSQYIKLVVPREICPEPKIDFSVFMYDPKNYFHWRPAGEYDLIIKNIIPKKKISSGKEMELF